MMFKQISLNEFREVVKNEHLSGHFKGDKHTMCVNFKIKGKDEDFIAVIMINDNNKEIMGFCGLDIFQSKNGKFGFIHCLGVPQKYRKMGYSVDLLNEVERLSDGQNLQKILSTCNPISAKSHLRSGYIITNEGRLTKSGERAQIRLEKTLNH